MGKMQIFAKGLKAMAKNGFKFLKRHPISGGAGAYALFSFMKDAPGLVWDTAKSLLGFDGSGSSGNGGVPGQRGGRGGAGGFGSSGGYGRGSGGSHELNRIYDDAERNLQLSIEKGKQKDRYIMSSLKQLGDNDQEIHKSLADVLNRPSGMMNSIPRVSSWDYQSTDPSLIILDTLRRRDELLNEGEGGMGGSMGGGFGGGGMGEIPGLPPDFGSMPQGGEEGFAEDGEGGGGGIFGALMTGIQIMGAYWGVKIWKNQATMAWEIGNKSGRVFGSNISRNMMKQMSEYGAKAREIQELQAKAKDLKIKGNTSEYSKLEKEILKRKEELRKQVTGSGFKNTASRAVFGEGGGDYKLAYDNFKSAGGEIGWIKNFNNSVHNIKSLKGVDVNGGWFHRDIQRALAQEFGITDPKVAERLMKNLESNKNLVGGAKHAGDWIRANRGAIQDSLNNITKSAQATAGTIKNSVSKFSKVMSKVKGGAKVVGKFAGPAGALLGGLDIKRALDYQSKGQDNFGLAAAGSGIMSTTAGLLSMSVIGLPIAALLEGLSIWVDHNIEEAEKKNEKLKELFEGDRRVLYTKNINNSSVLANIFGIGLESSYGITKDGDFYQDLRDLKLDDFKLYLNSEEFKYLDESSKNLVRSLYKTRVSNEDKGTLSWDESAGLRVNQIRLGNIMRDSAKDVAISHWKTLMYRLPELFYYSYRENEIYFYLRLTNLDKFIGNTKAFILSFFYLEDNSVIDFFKEYCSVDTIKKVVPRVAIYNTPVIKIFKKQINSLANAIILGNSSAEDINKYNESHYFYDYYYLDEGGNIQTSFVEEGRSKMVYSLKIEAVSSGLMFPDTLIDLALKYPNLDTGYTFKSIKIFNKMSELSDNKLFKYTRISDFDPTEDVVIPSQKLENINKTSNNLKLDIDYSEVKNSIDTYNAAKNYNKDNEALLDNRNIAINARRRNENPGRGKVEEKYQKQIEKPKKDLIRIIKEWYNSPLYHPRMVYLAKQEWDGDLNHSNQDYSIIKTVEDKDLAEVWARHLDNHGESDLATKIRKKIKAIEEKYKKDNNVEVIPEQKTELSDYLVEKALQAESVPFGYAMNSEVELARVTALKALPKEVKDQSDIEQKIKRGEMSAVVPIQKELSIQNKKIDYVTTLIENGIPAVLKTQDAAMNVLYEKMSEDKNWEGGQP